MRIEETFSVNWSPEAVFDYMTDPANLASWQTSKTFVEQLTDGPPGLGARFREGTRPPGGREFEQVRPRPDRGRLQRRARQQIRGGAESAGELGRHR